jgi:hypothetical protein
MIGKNTIKMAKEPQNKTSLFITVKTYTNHLKFEPSLTSKTQSYKYWRLVRPVKTPGANDVIGWWTGP